jgi:hypothetical protein
MREDGVGMGFVRTPVATFVELTLKVLWFSFVFLRSFSYCPSVSILKPGELMHINKGRLHAFRKLSAAKLPDEDCHAAQRAELVKVEGLDDEEQFCISIAWDWMNRGFTPEGISREVSTILEGTILNRKYGVRSLAIPEMCLLQMARRIPAMLNSRTVEQSFLSKLTTPQTKWKCRSIVEPSKEDICEGILPSLHYVAGRHIDALQAEPCQSNKRGERLKIAKKPDTQENPELSPLDPYGDSDYDCKICRTELSNVYYHCMGCEQLLSKDYNICAECHAQKKFMRKDLMHPTNDKNHATLNHTGK